MNILIGGDLVPCGGAEQPFENGDIEWLLGDELLKIWKEADYRFFNLECPITNSEKKIVKCGPCLKCVPDAINGIKNLYPSCVFLANNHIMDYSEDGLKDTAKILDDNKIKWVGVGKNRQSLKKHFVFDCDNHKVGIYNCCEHEFSIASEEAPGANPYDEFEIDDDLVDLRERVDFLVVIYHGGREHYRYPSPYLQKRCHKMIKDGADLVICQHSHCIGCEEKYNGKTIIYGQGNFIFNRQQNEFWNTSLLVKVSLDNDLVISYIPIVQSEYGTRLANDAEATSIMNDYKKRSEQIKKSGFIQNEYKKYAQEKLPGYLLRMKGGFWMKLVRRFCPNALTKNVFNCENILNSVDCEAHRELFIQGLKDAIDNKELERNKSL